MALALTLGAAVAGGVGWFLLSWLVMNETAGDAASEALGVAFGVLIVISVIGVIRASSRKGGPAPSPGYAPAASHDGDTASPRGTAPAEPRESTDSGEDPERRS